MIHLNHCLGCSKKAPLKYPLCKACIERLPWLTGNQCRYCAATLLDDKQYSTCGQCCQRDSLYSQLICPLQFSDSVKQLIHAMKYGQKYRLCRFFAEILTREIQSHHICSHSVIVPVALHPRKLNQRGYNQASEIGKYIAKNCQMTISRNALHKCRHTPSQTQLTAKKRRKNLNKAFQCHTPLKNKHVILVDDVITTGATLHAAAKALAIPPSQITAICIARS